MSQLGHTKQPGANHRDGSARSPDEKDLRLGESQCFRQIKEEEEGSSATSAGEPRTLSPPSDGSSILDSEGDVLSEVNVKEFRVHAGHELFTARIR
jgi:hypothetical protein